MLFGKLLPREGNFFELINQHGAHIAEGSRAFVAMIKNYADPVLRGKYAEAVDHAEHQADKVTAEVNRLLHKTFITPIDREQIHGLINTMDDVLDLLQDATETMSSIALIRLWICSRSIGVMKVLCSSRFTSAVILSALRSASPTSLPYFSRSTGSA